jgi:excisionase family DNA binding protein
MTSTGSVTQHTASHLRRTQLFSIPAIAERLDVSSRTVHRLITSRELVAHRIGGSVHISEADFKAYVARQRDAD